MSVEFDTSGQSIDFGSVTELESLTTMTISAWLYVKGYGYAVPPIETFYSSIMSYIASATGFIILTALNGIIDPAPITVTNGLYFTNGFSTTNGAWYANNTVSLNSWIHVAVSYDNTNVANDPVVYVDAVSKSVTEFFTPVGSSGSLSSGDFEMGSNLTDGNDLSMKGLIQDLRVYNRILPQAEITTLADSSNRCKYVITEGLVFWVPAVSAKDVADFDGETLSASDKIMDIIGDNEGTPAGSPIGRGATDKLSSAGADSMSAGIGTFHRIWMDDDGCHSTVAFDTG